MKLEEKELAELIRLYRRYFGTTLTVAEAQDQAIKLIQLVKLVIQPDENEDTR